MVSLVVPLGLQKPVSAEALRQHIASALST